MAPNTILEATMLVCFGCAWPLASVRMLRTRRAEGRGLLPTGLIFAGYLAGMAAKLVFTCSGGPLAPIFWMYFLNAGSVGVNLALQWHYSRVPTRRPGRILRNPACAAVERT
jgi:hypothetical protein